MSTISASTTSTTGYVVTSDTTGTLVFKTGASPTTAMSISSSQIISFTNPPTATGGGSVATNTAFGTNALAANTTGDTNTAVGYQALTSNQGGASNTAYGVQAMRYNTSGGANASYGRGALYSNTSGSYNVACGQDSLSSNTTASGNVAVGYQAGYTQTTAGGGYNTYIGYYAGRLSTSYQNVFIGSNAGENTTGANNTFIGVTSGQLVTSGNNNSILGRYSGNQGGLDIRTASNYIVLSDGDGNPRAFCNSNGQFVFTNSSTIYNVNDTAFQVNQSTNSEYTAQFVNSATTSPYGLFLRLTGTDPNNATSFVFGAYANTSSTYIYRIYSNGTVAARSDSRFKKNIETARDGYADDLSKLRIVKYNWYNHEDNEPKELGWIAQEVEEVFPGLVQTDVADDGTECKSVKLSVFTPMLIKAVQELNAQLKELKAEFDAYKEAHP